MPRSVSSTVPALVPATTSRTEPVSTPPEVPTTAAVSTHALVPPTTPSSPPPRSDTFEPGASEPPKGLPPLANAPAPMSAEAVASKLRALSEGSQRALTSLGLTTDDLRSAGEQVAPRLFLAVEAVSRGLPDKALEHLLAVGPAAMPLIQKAVGGLIQRLPEGMARTLLSDFTFLTSLVNDTQLRAGMVALTRPESRSEGARALLAHDGARDSVLRAVGSDPTLTQGLKRVGLSPQVLQEAGKAASPLWYAAEAFKDGKIKDGITALSEGLTVAPELSVRVAQLGMDRLPASARKSFEALGLTAQDVAQSAGGLPALYSAGEALAAQDIPATLAALSQAYGPASAVVQKSLAGLAKKLPEGAARALLTDTNLVPMLLSDTGLHQSVAQLFAPETRSQGLRGLISHDVAREAVLGALAKDPTVQSMLNKVGLTPNELPELGRVAPGAWVVIESLQAGDFEGAARALVLLGQSAPELATRLAKGLEKALPAPVKRALDQLGFDGRSLIEAGAALPALISAAKLSAAGDVQGALSALGDAVQGAPESLTRAVVALATKLPGNGLAKAMLTDPEVLKVLLGDKQLHRSVKGLLQGDLASLRDLSTNTWAAGPIAQRLWADEAMRSRLTKLGFDSAQDLLEGFGGVAMAMDLADKVKREDYRGAIDSLGTLATALPDGLRRRLTERATKAMKLPPGLTDLLVEGGLALSDGHFRKVLAEAGAKAQAGDGPGLLRELSTAGMYLAVTHPQAAASFLDTLQNLPGSMGRLFKDPELNRLLISTGTVGQLFRAAQRLAEGNTAGAAQEVGKAVTSLVTAGGRYSIAGYEMPVLGADGAKALSKLFERTVDALPPEVKAKVLAAGAQLAAKSGLAFVPVLGPALGAAAEAREILEGMRRVPPDYISITIDGCQLVLHVASVFPAAQPFVQPINMGLGFIEVAADARLLIQDLAAFKREFTGLGG